MSDERMLPVQELTKAEKAEIAKAHEHFFKCLNMKQGEKDDLFNSGVFNDLAIGYGKIALEMIGEDSKFLRDFERAMENAFSCYDAGYARKIYNRIEG